MQDDPAQLASSLPSLTELDLTCNLLHAWGFVESLCTAMPRLQVTAGRGRGGGDGGWGFVKSLCTAMPRLQVCAGRGQRGKGRGGDGIDFTIRGVLPFPVSRPGPASFTPRTSGHTFYISLLTPPP